MLPERIIVGWSLQSADLFARVCNLLRRDVPTKYSVTDLLFGVIVTHRLQGATERRKKILQGEMLDATVARG
ncbi:hypothetical protein NPIL_446191 [Nephila pilipes]|uniref:Uncharacterized protein n=1 Tax=Nephila pilipes TaxID=299642 RepID=A0A8X6PLQ9_NEPPI|nr:hypothetical protein NPIL_446191 [Nephila pilipes]